MGSGYDRKRMNVEGDRLSNLSDDLIHKILSFIGTKYAVRTSALSSRWRYTWTSMPSLSFSTKDFYTVSQFTKFVKDVLSNRNNQVEVYSVKLAFLGKVSQGFVKRILNYAFSHNVQQLDITCLSNIEFPLSILTSQSLKHLTLKGCKNKRSITTLLTWNLPALTTLNLHCIALCGSMTDKQFGLLSNCVNLKNLTLSNCRLKSYNGFNICHAGLSSLTLEDGCHGTNVITPQLKNLTIDKCRRIHLISAPNISSLHYNVYCCHGDDLLRLPTGLLHLEKVDICFFTNFQDTSEVVCLLQQLHSVKFLTLNLELVKLLSSSVELMSHQPSPFVNLKSLKIYPADLIESDLIEPKLNMSSEVKNFLLDRSPDSTLKMVSHEEIRSMMNVTSSRNLMTKLHVLIDEWKENYESKMAHMKQDMSTLHEQMKVQNNKMKWRFEERMTNVESYWKDLSNAYEKGRNYTRDAISMMRKIEEDFKKLPASHQDKFQARFSCLSEEADAMMDNTMDIMEMQCSKKPRRSNVSFHEFAASSHPS